MSALVTSIWHVVARWMKVVYIQQIRRTIACKCRVKRFCFFMWMSYYILIFYNAIWFILFWSSCLRWPESFLGSRWKDVVRFSWQLSLADWIKLWSSFSAVSSFLRIVCIRGVLSRLSSYSAYTVELVSLVKNNYFWYFKPAEVTVYISRRTLPSTGTEAD